MSMLYKSLQKLRKEEQSQGGRYSHPAWYSHKSDNRRLLRVGVVALVMVGLLMGLAFFLESKFQDYQQIIMIARENAHQVHEPALRVEQVDLDESATHLTLQDIAVHKDIDPEKKYTAETYAMATRPQTKPYPAISSAEPEKTLPDDFLDMPGDSDRLPSIASISRPLSGPGSQVLEEHFSQTAQRNHEILILSRSMQEDFQRRDRESLDMSLDRLKKLLPEQSPLLLKWHGIIALEDGSLDKAKKSFEMVLKQNPGDHEAKANLALVLSSLGQDQQARRMLDELRQIMPNHPLVLQLGRRLGP